MVNKDQKADESKNKSLDLVDEAALEVFESLTEQYGQDILFLRIYCLTYISPNPIGMEELAEKTGYSLASLSTRLRMLETMGIIKRTRKPGSKRIYVYMDKDIIAMMKDHIFKKEEYGFKILLEKLPPILTSLKSKKLTEIQKKKIKILEGYCIQTKKIQEIMYKMKKEFDNLN